jgi:hypothetical protein
MGMTKLAITNKQMYHGIWDEFKKRLSGITTEVTELKDTYDGDMKASIVWCGPKSWVEVVFLFESNMMVLERNTSLGDSVEISESFYYAEPDCIEIMVELVFKWHDDLAEEMSFYIPEDDEDVDFCEDIDF